MAGTPKNAFWGFAFSHAVSPARSLTGTSDPTAMPNSYDVTIETGWNAFFAPKSMPAEKVQSLGQAIQAAMADPALRKRFVELTMEPVSTSTDETREMLKAYRAQWEPVVKRSGYQQ